MLYTVRDCLPMSCLKYHDSLWKVCLIKLDAVWLEKKKLNQCDGNKSILLIKYILAIIFNDIVIIKTSYIIPIP